VLNVIAIDYKIMRVSFFGTHCRCVLVVDSSVSE